MYSITRVTPEQKQLLRALGLKGLADPMLITHIHLH
jgi:hypothetical protein